MSIVLVMSYFDDEQTTPAEYVDQHDDGGFEAFACTDEEQISLGLFESQHEAARAIWTHKDQLETLHHYWPANFNRPN